MPYVNNDKIAQAIIAVGRLPHRPDHCLDHQRQDFRLGGRIPPSVPSTARLGFIYGIGRGLVLVAIAYMFYSWANPPEKHEDWIRNAQTLPVIQSVSDI